MTALFGLYTTRRGPRRSSLRSRISSLDPGIHRHIQINQDVYLDIYIRLRSHMSNNDTMSTDYQLSCPIRSNRYLFLLSSPSGKPE